LLYVGWEVGREGGREEVDCRIFKQEREGGREGESVNGYFTDLLLISNDYLSIYIHTGGGRPLLQAGRRGHPRRGPSRVT